MGGGIGMGNTCKPMAVSFQCMTKSTTIKKKKKVKKKTCLFTEKWLQGDPALAKNLQKLLQRSKVKCFGLSGGWDRVVFSTHECTGPGGQQSSGNRDPRIWTGAALPPSPVWPLTALHVWGH